ncbi:hypothetical protein VYU27_003198 [Nannochloropsis oceanica]
MAEAVTNNSTKRHFALEVLPTAMSIETFTTSKIGLEEEEGGAILESMYSSSSPTKWYRHSRLQELVEEASSKFMRRSFSVPREVKDDAVGVDPFLPSFTKKGHPMLGSREAKP